MSAKKFTLNTGMHSRSFQEKTFPVCLTLSYDINVLEYFVYTSLFVFVSFCAFLLAYQSERFCCLTPEVPKVFKLTTHFLLVIQIATHEKENLTLLI